MDPLIGGALIGGGASILGGLIGGRSQEKASQANIDFQREFAQHGIRWRVEDATAAGLHPLYALGASTSTFSPSVRYGGEELGRSIADAGQSLGRAVQAQQTPIQRKLEQLALFESYARSDKDQAIAQYYRSQAARNAQSGNQSAAFPMFLGDSNVPELYSGQYDALQPKPAEVESRSSNVRSATAGSHAFWRAYEANDGRIIYLPYSEEGPSEVMENIPLWFWPSIMEYNRQKLGDEGVETVKSLIPFLNQ